MLIQPYLKTLYYQLSIENSFDHVRVITSSYDVQTVSSYLLNLDDVTISNTLLRSITIYRRMTHGYECNKIYNY